MSKQSGIFFVRNEQGMTRIARTRDLAKRMSEWQAASPCKLHVISKITTKSSRERALSFIRMAANSRVGIFAAKFTSDPSDDHVFEALKRHFSDSHVCGDWYSLDAAMLLGWPIEHSFPTDVNAELIGRATLAWQALEYANSKVPSSWDFDYKSPERTRQIEIHIIDWLTERSRHNIEVLFQFEEQLDLLRTIVYALGGEVGSYFDHFESCLAWALWLVLQGRARFASFIDNPNLALLFEPKSETCFVKSVLVRLIQFDDGLENDQSNEYYYHFMELRSRGDRPEDFTDWDADRLVAEYNAAQKFDED